MQTRMRPGVVNLFVKSGMRVIRITHLYWVALDEDMTIFFAFLCWKEVILVGWIIFEDWDVRISKGFARFGCWMNRDARKLMYYVLCMIFSLVLPLTIPFYGCATILSMKMWPEIWMYTPALSFCMILFIARLHSYTTVLHSGCLHPLLMF